MFNKKILLVVLFVVLFFMVAAKNVYAANDCSCTERVALNMYDIKSKIAATNNNDCMDKCRGNGNDFYSYPDVAGATGITVVVIDRFRYTYNCACLTGSTIPLYYPVSNLNQVTGGGTACNSVCYSKSAQYYAFEATGALSGWKTAVTAPPPPPPPPPNQTGGGPGIQNNDIPGTTEAGGLIQCGRGGQKMCTLCDLIKGMNIVIQYLMKIAIGVALLAMAIGGVMYIVSAGDSGMIDMAKNTLKNAAIGFVVIFAGYIIINTTINYLGANGTLGMKVATKWGEFNCDANSGR